MSINITEEFVRNLIEQNAALIAQVAKGVSQSLCKPSN